MAGLNGGQPIAVAIGECHCVGTPHPDGDIVYLAPKASLRLGLAANAAIGQAKDVIQLQELLGIAFVRYGVTGWNVVDEHGKPVDVNNETVEARLTWDAGGRVVADRAADLYTDAIISPLVPPPPSSPPPGPTASSTSPIPPYSPPPPISLTPSSPGNSEPST